MKRMYFWRALHITANRLAWRLACPPGPVEGRALRINRTHPLWRLNYFFADRYVPQWIQHVLDERKRKGARCG